MLSTDVILNTRFNYNSYSHVSIYLNSIALSKRLANLCLASESGENASLALPSVWRDVILDPIVLNLFFTVYLKIRNNPQIAHHAMSCLVQLASLHGTVLTTHDESIRYLMSYMEKFLTLVKNIDVNSQEAHGITSIMKKINCYFPLKFLPMSVFIPYVQEMTRLTCLFIEHSVHEESVIIALSINQFVNVAILL